MSAFNKWFKAQFGKLPNASRRGKLGIICKDAEYAAMLAKANYETEIYLHNAYTNALYGYNKAKGIKE